jgi:phosphoenolpyruvate-protein kinase (PTS system EI component)
VGTLERIADGDELILDGGQGVVWVAPSASLLTDYRRRQADRRKQEAAWSTAAAGEARTSDGRRVEVAANVGDLASARQAAANGAEGIGLLRTEIIAVVSRHVTIDPERVQVSVDRGREHSTLAVDIEIPNANGQRAA